jgi:hypothetical protein
VNPHFCCTKFHIFVLMSLHLQGTLARSCQYKKNKWRSSGISNILFAELLRELFCIMGLRELLSLPHFASHSVSALRLCHGALRHFWRIKRVWNGDIKHFTHNLHTFHTHCASLRIVAPRCASRFVADGPPSGGLVQSSPQSGYAVTTSFSGTTSAWYDEDVIWFKKS